RTRTGAGALPASFQDTLRLQVALDRAGYSPGVIDGKAGPKTTMAIKAYQLGHPAHAALAPDTAATPSPEAAADRSNVGPAPAPAPSLADQILGDLPTRTSYVVTQADLDSIGHIPHDWAAKAALPSMPYESMVELLAERGHCTRALVGLLNPG